MEQKPPAAENGVQKIKQEQFQQFQSPTPAHHTYAPFVPPGVLRTAQQQSLQQPLPIMQQHQQQGHLLPRLLQQITTTTSSSSSSSLQQAPPPHHHQHPYQQQMYNSSQLASNQALQHAPAVYFTPPTNQHALPPHPMGMAPPFQGSAPLQQPQEQQLQQLQILQLQQLQQQQQQQQPQFMGPAPTLQQPSAPSYPGNTDGQLDAIAQNKLFYPPGGIGNLGAPFPPFATPLAYHPPSSHHMTQQAAQQFFQHTPQSAPSALLAPFSPFSHQYASPLNLNQPFQPQQQQQQQQHALLSASIPQPDSSSLIQTGLYTQRMSETPPQPPATLAPNKKSAKKQVQTSTLKDRIAVVRYITGGVPGKRNMTYRQALKRAGVTASKQSVHKWLRQFDNGNMSLNAGNLDSHTKRLRPSSYPRVDNHLNQFINKQPKDRTITFQEAQEEALRIKDRLVKRGHERYKHFRASPGWFERFRKRYNHPLPVSSLSTGSSISDPTPPSPSASRASSPADASTHASSPSSQVTSDSESPDTSSSPTTPQNAEVKKKDNNSKQRSSSKSTSHSRGKISSQHVTRGQQRHRTKVRHKPPPSPESSTSSSPSSPSLSPSSLDTSSSQTSSRKEQQAIHEGEPKKDAHSSAQHRNGKRRNGRSQQHREARSNEVHAPVLQQDAQGTGTKDTSQNPTKRHKAQQHGHLAGVAPSTKVSGQSPPPQPHSTGSQKASVIVSTDAQLRQKDSARKQGVLDGEAMRAKKEPRDPSS